MSIVFLILKIIGILLLVLLCLILLILFHPIFYQVKGETEENRSVQGYFWWLFQILRLEFRWEEQEVKLRLRIFGFFKEMGEEEAEEDFLKSETEEYEEEAVEEEQERPVEGAVAEETAYQIRRFDTGEQEKDRFQKADKKEQDDLSRGFAAKKASDSRKKKKEKAKTGRKEKKRETEGGILNRLKGIRQEIKDERNHKAAAHLWRELCYLLAHLKPRYVKAEIAFSAGDPALTGEVTGVLSLFPVIYRYDVHIYPDFLAEKFYIKGSLKMKGHIAVFHFLMILIRLFLDKNIKRLYYKFK